MDCQLIQMELVAYHFATITDDARAGVEEHLLACPACLRDYVALKREVETASLREIPSPAAKARLRGAVAAEIGHARSWWERPLAYSLAAMTLTAALVSTHLLSQTRGTPPRTMLASER